MSAEKSFGHASIACQDSWWSDFDLDAAQVYTLNDAGLMTNCNLYYDTMTMLTKLGHMG